MSEVWFYELTREPLDAVLPKILAGLYARGEQAVVRCKSKEMIEDLSQKLWAIEDVSFVPHAVPGDPQQSFSPLRFSLDDATDAAPFAFYVEGTLPDEVTSKRASIMFEAMNEEALQSARGAWKKFSVAGHGVKYWKQNEQGRWEDQAAKAKQES